MFELFRFEITHRDHCPMRTARGSASERSVCALHASRSTAVSPARRCARKRSLGANCGLEFQSLATNVCRAKIKSACSDWSYFSFVNCKYTPGISVRQRTIIFPPRYPLRDRSSLPFAFFVGTDRTTAIFSFFYDRPSKFRRRETLSRHEHVDSAARETHGDRTRRRCRTATKKSKATEMPSSTIEGERERKMCENGNRNGFRFIDSSCCHHGRKKTR